MTSSSQLKINLRNFKELFMYYFIFFYFLIVISQMTPSGDTMKFHATFEKLHGNAYFFMTLLFLSGKTLFLPVTIIQYCLLPHAYIWSCAIMPEIINLIHACLGTSSPSPSPPYFGMSKTLKKPSYEIPTIIFFPFKYLSFFNLNHSTVFRKK